MPEIKKTVEVNAGYGCDICGKLISDGKHDGMGGINWWGMFLDFAHVTSEKVEVQRVWDAVQIKVRPSFNAEGRHHSMLCHDCGASIIAYIDQKKEEYALRSSD